MVMDLNLFPWPVVSFVGVILTAILVNIVVKIWWTPLRTQKFLRNQGIDGSPYKLLYGSTQELQQIKKLAKSTSMEITPHDIVHRIVPHIHLWAKQYGRIFVYWLGTTARIVVHDPEMMKQILSNKFGHYDKPEPNIQMKRLFGLYGLPQSNGEKWARQRRLLNPAFHLESLKSMVPVMAASTARMLEKWENAIADGVKEIEVSEEFRCLTADVIARTAFGTSFEQGKHIFHMLAELAILAGKSFGEMYFLGSRFLPTPSNLRSKKLDMAIQKSLRELILNRKRNVEMGKNDSYGTDLLGLMMNSYKGARLLPLYSYGHSFCLECIRTGRIEQGRKCFIFSTKKTPNLDSLPRLKLMNMILYEVLRLYPPVAFIVRKAFKEMQLGSLTVPAGAELVLPTITVHHDEELWGKDAKEFNPQRFSEGISKASAHPAAFTAFGFGPRTCIGQNFALIEAKVVLTMILQRFSFSLSPAHVHAPAMIFTVLPLHGAQIIFQQLPS